MPDRYSIPNDPTASALHAALDQLVESHPESRETARWVLTLCRATPPDFTVERVPAPTQLLMTIDADVTRVEVVHPEADDAENDAFVLPLTVDFAEQLVPVLLDLADNDFNALQASDSPCLHCGGSGIALPLWRIR